MLQIFVDVDYFMCVMCDESFGLVVGIMKVKDDVEVIVLMNDSNFGLIVLFWMQDVVWVEVIGDQIEIGMVFFNWVDYFDLVLCWIGCKDIGCGGGLLVIGYYNLI